MDFTSASFIAAFAVILCIYYIVTPRLRWVVLLVGGYSICFLLNPPAPGGPFVCVGVCLRSRSGHRQEPHAGGEATLARRFRDHDGGRSRNVQALAMDGTRAGRGGQPYRCFLAGIPGRDARTDWDSFYTLRVIAYLVDVYRGSIPVERHLGFLALYVGLLPELPSGPIDRPGALLSQLRSRSPFNPAQAGLGLQLFVWGLAKKVVVADRLRPFVDYAYTNWPLGLVHYLRGVSGALLGSGTDVDLLGPFLLGQTPFDLAIVFCGFLVLGIAGRTEAFRDDGSVLVRPRHAARLAVFVLLIVATLALGTSDGREFIYAGF